MLAGIAGLLGAADVAGFSGAERDLVAAADPTLDFWGDDLREQIIRGEDPLGSAFSRLRTPAERRPLGATYTPQPLVRWMLDWSAADEHPTRVVDPGVGSARFLLEAGRRFPHAHLIGIEIDPLAALIARANLAVAGLASRAQVLVCDYRALRLPSVNGATLFVGNPPYVRHHLIGQQWKSWLTDNARALKLNASQLAGLHVHFFLATALHARPGDTGTFITAAEWLDVNYGRLVRELFVGPLGGRDLVVLEPTAQPFPDAATTAAVTTFTVGSRSRSINVSRATAIDDLSPIGEGQPVHRDRFATADRWSHLTRAPRELPADFVELGELCRVHRGSVTGANKVWIAGDHSTGLPTSVLFPSITRAKELFSAGNILDDNSRLRCVIDLPVELDVFDASTRVAVERFLKRAKYLGADRGYIATHRKAWWSIGLRQPPPVMATYMARRPPAFVRNRAAARYINIAHGLYPREAMPEAVLMNLVRYLRTATCTSEGRTYSGGLTKFEPREMERILVPHPEMLAAGDFG
ncbi:N-6 DNA methylase [Longimicrobium sp.]|uniref:N-6 DNA methylase n=1 Tax=Longimicrobium sp. TaxID=2029185 RepID=UPI002D805B18|nr:N-6 DNA methylase [Longimicrobium sp.]